MQLKIPYHYKKRSLKPRFGAAFLENAASAVPLSRVFQERDSKERLEPRFPKTRLNNAASGRAANFFFFFFNCSLSCVSKTQLQTP